MSFEDKIEKELRIRRANAWKAFWGQKYIVVVTKKPTTYVLNYEFFTLLHKWGDSGQTHRLEKLQ